MIKNMKSNGRSSQNAKRVGLGHFQRDRRSPNFEQVLSESKTSWKTNVNISSNRVDGIVLYIFARDMDRFSAQLRVLGTQEMNLFESAFLKGFV